MIHKESKADIAYIVLSICSDCILIDCVGIIAIVFIYELQIPTSNRWKTITLTVVKGINKKGKNKTNEHLYK